MRRWAAPAVLVLGLCLAGCGGRHAVSPRLAAEVGGVPITWPDVKAHVTYVTHFYAASGVSTQPCPNFWSAGCATLRRQVLARLIQEQVVVNYATRHGIVLTAADRARAGRVSGEIIAGSPGLHSPAGMPSMVRAIVSRELLVQEVEAVVTRSVPTEGPSYHLTRYLVPAIGSRHQAYLAASHLAVGDGAVPPNTTTVTEWKAAFRLPTYLRTPLSSARPGDNVGPFSRLGGYEVVRFLQQAVHRYGAPAERALRLARFTTWLRHQVTLARPICYTAGGKVTGCPRQ